MNTILLASLIFLTANAPFLFVDYSLTAHIIANFSAVVFLMVYFYFEKRTNEPKSMADSIRAGKMFFQKAMLSGTDVEPPLEVVEAARYKEDVLKTKKDAVHSLVFKNVKDDENVLIKDDPYIKSNPSSIVFFNPKISFVDRPYQTKAELEREIRYIQEQRKKEPKVKYKMEIKKKEEGIKA